MEKSLVNLRVSQRNISRKFSASLQTLPIELVYRILDELDESTLLLSCYNVCTKLNMIINTYRRYCVNIRMLIEKMFFSMSEIDDHHSEISIAKNNC